MAATLIYRDGIHATGVDRLAQEASVSKRTFYQRHQLAVLFEGSSALSTSLNDRAPLVHARSAAAALIDAAIAD